MTQKLMRHTRRFDGALLVLASLTLSSPSLAGAQHALATNAPHSQEKTTSTTAQSSQRQKTPPRVTLNVRDSSLSYVVSELARQAGVRLLFDEDHPLPAKRISLNVTNVRVMDAIEQALRGTEWQARLATDGTVVIRRAAREEQRSVVDSVATLSGRVIDSTTRAGINGVTITHVGTNRSVVAREDGTFTLSQIPVGEQVFAIRALGYESHRMTVIVRAEGGTPVTVVLNPGSTSLAEVVTTATGQQKRVEIANDIAKIDAEKIMQRAPIRSLTDLIAAAQVPGVQITPSTGEPGAPSRIRMRGIGSISQSNDPVVIVDGVWINAATSTNDIVRNLTGGGGSGLNPSRIDDIDPSTIETIEIVRGPSAATLYGQDAANGVIVITTKRGQSGTTRWNFSLNRDWSTVPGTKPPIYYGYGENVYSVMQDRCNIVYLVTHFCLKQDSVISIAPNDPLLSNEGPGSTNRYTLSLDGGTQQVLYAIQGVYQGEIGPRRTPAVDLIRTRRLGVPMGRDFRIPSELTRRSLSSRVTARPFSTLDLSLTLAGNQTNQQENNLSLGIPTTNANTIDIKDTIHFQNANVTVTPIEASNNATTGMVSLQSDWRPRTWWRSSLQTGVERTVRQESNRGTQLICAGGDCFTDTRVRGAFQEELSVYTVRFQSSALPTLRWVDRFLSIKPAFGADLRKNTESSVRVTGSGIATDPNGVGSSDNDVTGGAYAGASATAGWYLNTTIGVFERLYFDAGVRQDIGSAINDAKNAIYPKFGLSWLASDEAFFPRTPLMSTLRLRIAFGHAAVQPDVTDIRGRYVSGQLLVNGQLRPTINFDGIGNTLLEPERATEMEAGFDADLLDDRVQLGVTFVHKQNRNNLIDRALAPSAGVPSTRKENVAKVVNRGLEVSVTGRVIERPGLLLVVTSSMSMQDNQVKVLGSGVSPFGSNDARIAAGYPIGGLWRRPVLGYADLNGDGYISASASYGISELILGDTVVYMGWMQPRFQGGYMAQLTLRNLITFDAQFGYQGGYTQLKTTYDGLGLESAEASLAEQALGRIATTTGIPQTISSLRFNSASATFHLPQAVLSKMKARSAQISLQGSNLGLWTKYRGRDPGVNSTPVGEQLQDHGDVIPPPRRYSLVFRFGY